MNPALSVIFFTVTAGTGFGFIILLALARLAGLADGISSAQIVAMGCIGLVFVTAGLVASTFHLANPKNAWRAFTRFRTSWLSREGVFAVIFYPVCLVWLALEWGQGASGLSTTLALLVAALALSVLICTGMIYASLKTIRQWHTALTPVNYVLLSLLCGAFLMMFLKVQQDLPVSRLLGVTIVLLLITALAKIAYFAWIGQPAGSTINTALGFTRATVRLLDVGHTSDTFLTREFGFQVARARIIWLRLISVLLAFVIPLALLLLPDGGPSLLVALLCAVMVYAGVFVERWLFFAEARHVVNLYHGAQRT